MSNGDLFKIEFYVPEEQLQQVKQAMFDAGAGRVGDYDSCAWQVLGQGQYRPGAESNPFKGERGRLETLSEYKVEMVCAEKFIAEAIGAMKKAHPYEEVAYAVFRSESIV
ncbi:MAG: hypothetical protein DHS20C12_06820 [Pseudohongiella sp.]|nr:MAG: hypothetical protein DHS20C12_06820 [Pseudohongiella sp.]